MNEKGLKDLTFIDLFAGIGGFHSGLKKMGMICEWACEWDEHAAKVYEKNFKIKPKGDIHEVNEKEVKKAFMICGGFPCQAFSIAGKQQGFLDERGTLFFEVIRLVQALKPEVVFLENVKNFESHNQGESLKTVINSLKSLDYDVFYKVINAADHGFPTARKRIYFVAFKTHWNISEKEFQFPKELDPQDVLEKSALKHYLDPRQQWKKLEIKKTCQIDRLKVKNQKTLVQQKPGEPLRLGTIAGGGQGDRIYSVEAPAITLSAYGGGNAAKTGAYWINGKVRKLSVKECGRIMGFEPNFKWDTKETQAYKQLGNSVVVGVIHLIAQQIEKALNQSLR